MTNERMNQWDEPQKKAREVLLERIRSKYPDAMLESDEDLFDRLLDYEQELCACNSRLLGGQRKLVSLFNRNPRVGAMIADVVGGDDALVACVRHFGKELLQCADDGGRMEEIYRANDEFMERNSRCESLHRQQRENWTRSRGEIERFKASMELEDSEFESFMDSLFELADAIFMGNFTADLLQTLYRGFNYEAHLKEVEQAAEVKGRNQRIVLEKGRSAGDTLSGLHSRRTEEPEGDDLTPFFGLKRRKSVWDL